LCASAGKKGKRESQPSVQTKTHTFCPGEGGCLRGSKKSRESTPRNKRYGNFKHSPTELQNARGKWGTNIKPSSDGRPSKVTNKKKEKTHATEKMCK